MSRRIFSAMREPGIGSSFTMILTSFQICWGSGLGLSPEGQGK